MNPEKTELWRSLIADHELPDDIAGEAKHLLRAFDKATEHQRELTARYHTLSTEETKTRQAAPRQVAGEHIAGSKPSTLRLAGDLVMMEAAKQEAQVAVVIANQAISRCRGELSSLTHKHRDTLIRHVAERRATNLGAIGYSDQISKNIERLWAEIRPTFFGDWPEETGLRPDYQRIPIVFDGGWPREQRAGFAWIWQELAAGRWEWSAPRGKPDAEPTRLRITSVLMRLPTVPATPPHQTSPRLRFGASA